MKCTVKVFTYQCRRKFSDNDIPCFHLKHKIQGSGSFYCFSHDTGNHDNHNLFLRIVIATETIELIKIHLINIQ